MKILFVSDVSIQDVVGGAERVLYEQTTRLAARGHEVQVLTRKLPAHPSDHLEIENVKEWRYPVEQRDAASFFLSTLRNGKKLFEHLCRRGPFDCLNFQQPFSAFAVLRSDLCLRVPKVYTCLSFAFEEYISRNPKPPSLAKRAAYGLHVAARKWIEGRALKRSDLIVSLSRFTSDRLLNVYGFPTKAIALVPAGIDLRRFHPAQDKDEVKKKLRLPGHKFILFTVRNLVPRMGLENLIRAMRDIVQALPEVHLVIGGKGPLKDKLQALSRQLNLEQCIDFAGFIHEDCLPTYYQAADLFILPTLELEGFGLVTLEALASGVPVLGTPIGGTLDILGGFDRAFLFEGSHHDAISRLTIETCRKYRTDSDRWREDSRRCRRYVESVYSWDANIDATERLLLGMLPKKW